MKTSKTWHVKVGENIHDFTKKHLAQAYALWMLGDERLVWASWSE